MTHRARTRFALGTALALVHAACGDARGGDRATGTGADGGDATGRDAASDVGDADSGGADDTGGGPAESGSSDGGSGDDGNTSAADSGGDPDGLLVGELSRIPTPGGSASGPFALAFSTRLQGQDANKSFPVIAEITGDDVLDVAVDPRLGFLSVYPGVGDGSLGAPISPADGWGWGVDVGDFTGDGLRDVAIGDHGLGARAFANQGGGSMSDSSAGLPTGLGLSGCALGDFSGDGLLDYIGGADQFGSGLVLAFAEGGGTWASQNAAGLPPYETGMYLSFTNAGSFFAGDFDGDGLLDFAVASQDGTSGMGYTNVDVFLNGGDGITWEKRHAFGPSIQIGEWIGWDSVTISAADADGDGDLDLAAFGAVLLGDGDGGFVEQQVGMPDSEGTHFADMDGDGAIDVVTHGQDGLQVWLGDGSGSQFSLADVGLDQADNWGPCGLDVGDLDGNGNLDLVRTYLFLEDGELKPEPRIETWVR